MYYHRSTTKPEHGTPEQKTQNAFLNHFLLRYFCDCKWFAKMQCYDAHFTDATSSKTTRLTEL